MIYGYARHRVDEVAGLLEMREITLQFAPRDLLRIADFLSSIANSTAAGNRSHTHIDSFDENWRRDHPNVDLIVAPENEDPQN